MNRKSKHTTAEWTTAFERIDNGESMDTIAAEFEHTRSYVVERYRMYRCSQDSYSDPVRFRSMLSKRLRHAMFKRGMTANALSAASGVSHKTIGNITNGASGTNVHSLCCICRALSVSMDWMTGLVGGDE